MGLTQQDIDKVLLANMPQFAEHGRSVKNLLRWAFRIGYKYAKEELQ